MTFLCTVHGLDNYYQHVTYYNRNDIPWNAVNRPDGGWDFYRYPD